MLEILAHSVMFNCEEYGVENYTEGDDYIEDRVINYCVQKILCFEPALIVKAAGLTPRAVPVIAGL